MNARSSKDGLGWTNPRWLAAGVAALGLVGIGIWLRIPSQLREWLQGLLAWIGELGWKAPFIFILVYILAAVCFVPGSLLTLGAGALFGVLRGSVYVSVGATIGATAAFLIGRYLARGWVTKKIAGRPSFAAIDAAVAKQGWKIVFLTRLSPVFPFSLLNYAFGLTKIPLRQYVLASWIGMIPGTVMYVYLGSLIQAGAQQTSPGEWALRAVGLIATVLVTILLTRIAKQALATRIGTHER